MTVHFRRIALLGGVLVGVAIAYLLLSVIAAHKRVGGKVFTVQQMKEGLIHSPSTWLHHSVQIEGRIGELGPLACAGVVCPQSTLGLYDDRGPLLDAQFLRVAPGSFDPFLTFVRQVPILRTFLPQPQYLATGARHVYQVQLQTWPCRRTVSVDCYVAIIPDAYPAHPTGLPLITASSEMVIVVTQHGPTPVKPSHK